MLRKIGLSSFLARARASAPHGYQSTGLFWCWRRYGDDSLARRFGCWTGGFCSGFTTGSCGFTLACGASGEPAQRNDRASAGSGNGAMRASSSLECRSASPTPARSSLARRLLALGDHLVDAGEARALDLLHAFLQGTEPPDPTAGQAVPLALVVPVHATPGALGHPFDAPLAAQQQLRILRTLVVELVLDGARSNGRHGQRRDTLVAGPLDAVADRAGLPCHVERRLRPEISCHRRPLLPGAEVAHERRDLL